MGEDRKYLGGDNVLRSKHDHLAYLEQCARAWEGQFVPGWYGPETRDRIRKGHRDQADRIRDKIKEIEEEK